MKILALAVMLAVAGCAHDEKLSDQPTQAAAQIQGWVPVGTLQTDAQHIMEQHHFTCSVMTNSSFVGLTNADFLYCDYRLADSRVSPIVTTRWQVALVLADGKISAVHVTTGLIGP